MARQKLGQHFLEDNQISKKIVESALLSCSISNIFSQIFLNMYDFSDIIFLIVDYITLISSLSYNLVLG